MEPQSTKNIAIWIKAGIFIFSFVMMISFLLVWKFGNSVPFLSKREGMLGKTISGFPSLYSIAGIQFETSKGEILSLKENREKVVLINLIFTRCHGPCPTMSASLQSLLGRLKEKSGFEVWSITVDPDFDSVDRLDKYGRMFQYDQYPWKFLRTNSQDLHRFAVETLKLTAGDGNPDLHTTRWVLFDQKGHNRGYYDSSDPRQIDKLLRDVHLIVQ